MVYEIKDDYIGRCKKCRRKYACSERETHKYFMSEYHYIICPVCGERVDVFEKGSD